MAASQEQKLDYLLKKIGYVSSKTGIAEDENTLSGTKKAPFAEPIPSPLVVPSTNIWADSSSIPSTPPGADTSYVQVYLAVSSGHRMTVDSTVSGNRTFIAYSTYNNTSTDILGDWIDPSFGSDYVIKVYKGDPNSGGVLLSAAGTASNDTWFFDYSSGVLNFNGSQVPSGVTSSNIYIVGYRYIGNKGAASPVDVKWFDTAVGIWTSSSVGIGTTNATSTLTVDGTLNVTGVSTFQGNVDLGDNDRIRFYDSNTAIYGNVLGLYLTASGNRDITIKSNNSGGSSGDVIINTTAGGYLIAKGADGVELHHNGTTDKKLETTSTGVTVTGALTAGGLTYPTSNGTSGQVLTSDGAGNVSWATPSGLQTRTTAQVTVSATQDVAVNTQITTPNGYALLAIGTSHAAWVTLYMDTNSRSLDAGRGETSDPVPGSGVLAEIITTGSATQYITPGAFCFNTASNNTTYIKAVGKAAGTVNLTITLTYIQLEG